MSTGQHIKLPQPQHRGQMSVEEAILRRRSVRRYRPDALSLSQLSQLLWSAQGITSGAGLRAVPSAGALYPLDLFVVVNKAGVAGLEAGVYLYSPDDHSLSLHRAGDVTEALTRACLGQRFLRQAPVSFVVCAAAERTEGHYGRRGERYIHFEVGHLGQNVSLQAVALDLATVMVGAFSDEQVALVIAAPADLRPLYVIPVGKPL